MRFVMREEFTREEIALRNAIYDEWKPMESLCSYECYYDWVVKCNREGTIEAYKKHLDNGGSNSDYLKCLVLKECKEKCIRDCIRYSDWVIKEHRLSTFEDYTEYSDRYIQLANSTFKLFLEWKQTGKGDFERYLDWVIKEYGLSTFDDYLDFREKYLDVEDSTFELYLEWVSRGDCDYPTFVKWVVKGMRDGPIITFSDYLQHNPSGSGWSYKAYMEWCFNGNRESGVYCIIAKQMAKRYSTKTLDRVDTYGYYTIVAKVAYAEHKKPKVKDLVECVVFDGNRSIKLTIFDETQLPVLWKTYVFKQCKMNYYKGVPELTCNSTGHFEPYCNDILFDEEVMAEINKIREPSILKFYEKIVPLGFRGYLHQTSIDNLYYIFRDGFLASRKWVSENHPGFDDHANQEVISGTSDEVKNCVRFYLRPGTKTNYKFEKDHGMAYLLFDWDIINMDGALITNGNARADATSSQPIMGYIRDPQIEIEWKKVFDKSPPFKVDGFDIDGGVTLWDVRYNEERQSELLVPGFVPLTHLKRIIVKDYSDKLKVMNIIEQTGGKYASLIIINDSYFFRRD